MQIVIDILDEQYKRICDHTDGVYDMISLLTIIENGTPLPKAYWIERFKEEDKWLECSNCHCDSDEAYNFCPNCGADMRGDE